MQTQCPKLPPEVISFKRANTPSLAAYRVSATAIQLCNWGLRAAVDHGSDGRDCVPPDTSVDNEENITSRAKQSFLLV